MDITPFLQAAQSPDAAQRNQAEKQLELLEEQNAAAYLSALATELANSQKPADARQIAGLILKNALGAADEAKKAAQVARWLGLDEQVKQHVKNALLATLPSDVAAARHTAALVIAKVAAIELPQKQWQGLISMLLSNMGASPPSSGRQQATLQALGYICEEMGALTEDVLAQEQVNSILTAVVQGMRKEELDLEVRLAATQALFNALEFASTNFGNETERNYLMQVICEAAIGESVVLREAAFECLVKVAGLYYDTLPAYMEAIFTLTQRAVSADEEDVSKQAIEFWCSICEEEMDLIEVRRLNTLDLIEAAEGGGESGCHQFVKQALQPLVALLLGQLTKQEEGQDLDESIWNVSMAAGTCLSLVAQTVGDDAVVLTMPYVQENIHKKAGPEDWRAREAATFVFGCILEGPSVGQVAQLVGMGLQFLMSATKDPSAQVRLTTMWTIGRIFEFVHGSEEGPPVITPANLPPIVQMLQESIRDEPHIAEKVCYAFSQLAAGFVTTRDGTSPLSPYFKDIIQSLLEASEKPSEGTRLQTAAFEAINDVVRVATADTLPLVVQLIPLFIGKLSSTLHLQADTAEAMERQSEVQGLLCGVLTVIVQKLSETESTKSGVLQYADSIMEVFLQVFACRSATVLEEAMLAVGALTYATGRQFIKYMERFFPVLEQGLTNHQEWQVCQISVGVLGDISRALEDQLQPFCNRLMQILLENLQSDAVNRNVKPQILSAFGDIALAISDKYEVYLSAVLSMLQSAQNLSVQQQQSGDDELFEYNNQLRHGIFEAYSGILNGMSREKVSHFLLQPSVNLLDFMEYVANDKDNSEAGVLKVAVSLLGDLASNVAGVGQLMQQKPYISAFVQECQQSADDDGSLAEAAQWAGNAIMAAMSQGSA